MENKEIGIYVHIPFCKKKCDYCDFISYGNKYGKIQEYVEAVKKEIELQKIKSEIKIPTEEEMLCIKFLNVTAESENQRRSP